MKTEHKIFQELLEKCVAEHLSLDALIIGQAKPLQAEITPTKSADEIARGAARGRFPKLIADIADFGRRGVMSFAKRPDEKDTEDDWLSYHFTGLRTPVPPHNGRVPSGKSFIAPVRLTLGECLARCLDEMSDFYLSRHMMDWIGRKLGYSLDWLFFGAGEMLQPVFRPLNIPVIESNDTSQIRMLTTWTNSEWQWLFNCRHLVKRSFPTPTIPMIGRVVTAWNMPPVTPEMPDLAECADWIYKFVLREFFNGNPAKGWKQGVIEIIASGRTKVYMLYGCLPQSSSAWRNGRKGSASIGRIAWLLETVIRRWGRKGFLQYLDLLDEEAVAHGFRNLNEVFLNSSWACRINASKKKKQGGASSHPANDKQKPEEGRPKKISTNHLEKPESAAKAAEPSSVRGKQHTVWARDGFPSGKKIFSFS